jgi:hypothetical protein
MAAWSWFFSTMWITVAASPCSGIAVTNRGPSENGKRDSDFGASVEGQIARPGRLLANELRLVDKICRRTTLRLVDTRFVAIAAQELQELRRRHEESPAEPDGRQLTLVGSAVGRAPAQAEQLAGVLDGDGRWQCIQVHDGLPPSANRGPLEIAKRDSDFSSRSTQRVRAAIHSAANPLVTSPWEALTLAPGEM